MIQRKGTQQWEMRPSVSLHLHTSISFINNKRILLQNNLGNLIIKFFSTHLHVSISTIPSLFITICHINKVDEGIKIIRKGSSAVMCM